MALISVIVPVYKVEPYLSRCVDSILNQTFEDYELILVDDGSPDNCGIICDEYAKKDTRINVIHQINSGLSVARNVAIDWTLTNSKSEWLCFIDSDDWVHPQFLELLYKAARDTSTQISMCKFKRVNDQNNTEIHCLKPRYKVIDSVSAYTHGGKDIYAYTCDKLYKKELWDGIRFPSGRNWEDIATTYKVLLETDRIAYVDYGLYFYYMNPNGIVKMDWTPKKLDHLWAINEVLNDSKISTKPELVKLFHKQQLYVLKEQIDQIKKSKVIQIEEKQKYSRILRRDLRKALILYKKELNLSVKTHRWYYELAYPKIAWIYWTIKGISKKLIKGKTK